MIAFNGDHTGGFITNKGSTVPAYKEIHTSGNFIQVIQNIDIRYQSCTTHTYSWECFFNCTFQRTRSKQCLLSSTPQHEKCCWNYTVHRQNTVTKLWQILESCMSEKKNIYLPSIVFDYEIFPRFIFFMFEISFLIKCQCLKLDFA